MSYSFQSDWNTCVSVEAQRAVDIQGNIGFFNDGVHAYVARSILAYDQAP